MPEGNGQAVAQECNPPDVAGRIVLATIGALPERGLSSPLERECA